MPALKIACIGSAPSSVKLAPFGDPTWKIFGCSPGVMQYARRVHAWMELHRWEPGVPGQPETQKQWFSPEYVQWMSTLPCVYMYQQVPQIPNSRALPVDVLVNKYGNIWFTSSIAWMMALAIDDILERRRLRASQVLISPTAADPDLVPLVEGEQDTIGLWGVDMAATEEYGYQRAGCQRFIEIAATLGILVILPPESDLMRPMPLYGIMESSHWHIKGLARQNELQQRLANVQMNLQRLQQEEAFVRGALDDHKYHMDTWGEDRQLLGMDPTVLIESPILEGEFMKVKQADIDARIGAAFHEGANKALGDALAKANQELVEVPPPIAKRIQDEPYRKPVDASPARAKRSPKLAARIQRGKTARITR